MKTYIAIDLKSFFASVECVERGFDPLNTNLLVADNSRTDKTICLAVTPSLKSYGIPGRPRLFEVIQKVKLANARRLNNNNIKKFTKKSCNHNELMRDPNIEIDYIVAMPRMGHYLNYSMRIYDIYLKFIAPEDIHVYSIDEVFIDVTNYLTFYGLTPQKLAMNIINTVLQETGITATAGIGTNLYLSKIAMDIVAKKLPPDENGVRIATLDEKSYRNELWAHTPITDFWRIGKGYEKKLHDAGLYSMGDVARCSLGGENDFHNSNLLYKLFGVNAELLIDHAWGYEPCTIKDIKSYKPISKSINSGQVLHVPYDYIQTRLVVKEMIELISLDLLSKKLVTNQITITLNYDSENIKHSDNGYEGPIAIDAYGRKIPKHSHGTENISNYTSSSSMLRITAMSLYDRIVNEKLLIRKITISVNKLMTQDQVNKTIRQADEHTQLSLFDELSITEENNSQDQRISSEKTLEKEEKIQSTVLDIKSKHGKNAILKGMNLMKGATSKDRNKTIGGHRE